METQCLNSSVQSNEHSREYSRYMNLKKMENSHIHEILTQQQEQIKYFVNIQEIHYQYQISKAKICGGKLDLLLVIHRFSFEGSVKDKIHAQRQWLINFYSTQANIDLEKSSFCPRIDFGLVENPGNLNSKLLLVNGIDLLQTHDIINRFFRQNPKVAWVDASHCLLNFQSEALVTQFFKSQLVNKQELTNLPFRNWVEIKGYSFLNEFDRKIYARQCTELDQRQIALLQKNDALYQKFKRANKKLQYDLLQNSKIRVVFEKLIYEEIANQMVGPNCFRKKKKATIDKMTEDCSTFIQNPNMLRHESDQRQHKNTPIYAESNNDQRYRYSLEYYRKNFIPQLKSNNANKAKLKQKGKEVTNNIIPAPIDLKKTILEKKRIAQFEYRGKVRRQQGYPNLYTLFNEADIMNQSDQKKLKERKLNSVPQIDTSFHFDQPQPNQKNSNQLLNLLEKVDYSFGQEDIALNTHENANKMANNPNKQNTFRQNNYYQHNNHYWQNNKQKNYQQYFLQPKKTSNIWNSSQPPNIFVPLQMLPPMLPPTLSQVPQKTLPQMPPHGSSNNSSIPERSNHYLNINNFSISNQFLSSNSLSNHHFSSNEKPKRQRVAQKPSKTSNNANIFNTSGIISSINNSAGLNNKTSTSGIVSLPSQNSQNIDQKSQQSNQFLQKIQSNKNANPSVFHQAEVKTEWPFRPVGTKPIVSYLNNQSMSSGQHLQKLQEQIGANNVQPPHFVKQPQQSPSSFSPIN